MPKSPVMRMRSQASERKEEAESQATQLVSALCHELRSSLTGIDGNVHILAASIEDVEELLYTQEEGSIDTLKNTIASHLALQKRALHTIDACIRHQDLIIDDAMKLSRLESSTFELRLRPMDPKKVILDVVAMLNSEVTEKQLEVYLNLSYEDTAHNIDPDRLRQILLNLLSNAIKFTPKGGEITIAMAKPEVHDTNTFLKLSIKDNGRGMTEEELERIYTPNPEIVRSATPPLGLSISKQLIELMGGKMSIESTKGKGSKFSFTVKCPTAPFPKEKNVSPVIFSKPIAMGIQRKHILIVENNKVNQEMVKDYLEKMGYRCRVANNGIEALDLITQFNFNAVLMDIDMPIMGGLQATRLIREQEAANLNALPLHIIGLSTADSKETEQTIIEAGMNICLTKPFDKENLLEALEYCPNNTGHIKRRYSRAG